MRSDVVIVGGGPAGTASAMFLAQQGITSTIIESEKFPRFHIGESMTGECGNVVRQLGFEDEMYRRKFPRKQGVKVYGQSASGTWFVPVSRRDENWQLQDAETWQVRRADFDEMMLRGAVERGANLVPGRASRPIVEDGVVKGVEVRMDDGGTQTFESEVLLDCSGAATFLAKRGVTGPKYLGAYDKQIAIFSHVSGAELGDDMSRMDHKDNTLIFYAFKYHWAWLIPLSDDVVSIGIVVPSAYFQEKGETLEAFYLRELHELHPELARRVPDPKLVEDVHVCPNYSYQVNQFTGKGFVCVGDSHRFLDPIFSFGLSVAVREASFVAPAVADYLNGKNRDMANPFADHQLFCEKGIDVLEDVLDAFWENPLAFALFVHQRYTEFMIDMFAGRIYEHEHQPSVAAVAFRKLLGRHEQREESYQSDTLYSIPIGSRYHPERAKIWDGLSEVQGTEAWISAS